MRYGGKLSGYIKDVNQEEDKINKANDKQFFTK